MANTGNWTEEELAAGFILPEGSNTETNQQRVDSVATAKNKATNKVRDTYDSMVSQSDRYYQDQINAVNNYAETQKKLQQEQTDFAIEQIEQQKAQAKQDYTKEQSGAYVDWQKQSGDYGVNAEQMAVQGMGNTGYSESAQVSMYNTYQNRVATARESYNRAVLNYDNAIKDARLQNNAALAEIAYNALQKQLELSLEGFQYKNSLIMEKTNKEMEIDSEYWGRYTDVLDQINTENALAEEVRQYNESLKEEQRQYNQSLAMEKAKLAEEQRQFNAQQEEAKLAIAKTSSRGASNSSYSKNRSKTTNKTYKSSVNKSSVSKEGFGTTSGKIPSSGSSKATIDMNSVLALGYGPISASRLNELEEQGIIQSYKSGNKIKFKKSAYALKQSMLFK